MTEITITANDAGRRLDRFLRKYLPNAPLGEIYRIIRKDVKVCSKRRNESYILQEGDVLTLYLTDEALAEYTGRVGHGDRPPGQNRTGNGRAKRTFGIVYEDDNIMIVSKPFGLLTHGDSKEKKDHLANQVKDYLIAEGAYDPRSEKVFAPAPANRIDRNTTGIVLFGKTAEALRSLTRMIRENEVSKYYFTIACGVIEDELRLSGALTKDEASNKVSIVGHGDRPHGQTAAKHIETIVRPLEVLSFGDGLRATLCEVELVTGRTHQIRAHLADAGHPLIGDSKYAVQSHKGRRGGKPRASCDPAAVNAYVRRHFGLSTQLLHAGRIIFTGKSEETDCLGYLAGRSFEATLPDRFRSIYTGLGGRSTF